MAKPKDVPKPPEGSTDAKPTEYVVQWNLHGLPCGPLEAGEVVELTDEDAAPLVASGVLVPVVAEAETED